MLAAEGKRQGALFSPLSGPTRSWVIIVFDPRDPRKAFPWFLRGGMCCAQWCLFHPVLAFSDPHHPYTVDIAMIATFEHVLGSFIHSRRLPS